jgi:hypothetical protein
VIVRTVAAGDSRNPTLGVFTLEAAAYSRCVSHSIHGDACMGRSSRISELSPDALRALLPGFTYQFGALLSKLGGICIY